MKRILTEEQESSLCREYESGATPLDLTLKYGVAQNTVWYILKRHGIETGKFRKQKGERHI